MTQYGVSEGSSTQPTLLVIEVPHRQSPGGDASAVQGLFEGYALKRVGPTFPTELFHAVAPAAAIIIHSVSRLSALDAIRRLRSLSSSIPIMLLAQESCESFAIEAFHTGVTKFFRTPWNSAEVSSALQACTPQGSPLSSLSEKEADSSEPCPLIGTSAAIAELRACIRHVAPTDSNVLITGETGTGKELVAQMIHAQSRRYERPFVCLNSTAVPESLIESELFGYERGAFTGAHTAYEGKLAAANRGTIFFDEIGDTSLLLQAKLLRVLESRSLYRLGSTLRRDLDIRVLAATNQDLEAATKEQRFRSDLYYRLNVIRIEIPPLRERSEDIPALASHYVRRLNTAFEKQVVALSSNALEQLMVYPWPGNIRELRNVLEATFVHLDAHADGVIELPRQVAALLGRSTNREVSERLELLGALAATKWNKTEAAKALHWSRMTLYRKMARYRISSAAPSGASGQAARTRSGETLRA